MSMDLLSDLLPNPALDTDARAAELRSQMLTLQRLNTDQVPLRAAVSAPWWSAVIISVVPRWMLRPVLYVHPRLMLRAMRNRLRLLHGQQAHRSAH